MSPSIQSTRVAASALIGLLMLGAPAHADVRVDSTYVEGDVKALGGGGATPVPAADFISQLSYNGMAQANTFADTTVATAFDGLGNPQGSGQGIGSTTVDCTTAGTTLSGTGSTSAFFQASGGLGVGEALTRVNLDINFRVTGAPVNYTLVLNLLGQYESGDQVQLRKLGPVGYTILGIVSPITPSQNISGTLQPGVYRLFGFIAATESGGSAQGSGTEVVGYDYNLTFDSATILTFNGAANTGNAFCFGDGSGSPCPCGNSGALGAGCANSTSAGAVLTGIGGATFADDYFALNVSGIPPSNPGLCVKGSLQLGSGNPVGDGLLCANPQLRSQVISANILGDVVMKDWHGQPFGTYPFAANVGSTTYYQWWYRDVANPCTGAGFNFSNAWQVDWL